MKAFISSQFSYCPLIWMNHYKTLNNKINMIHDRSLRVVYNDKKVTFKELLDNGKAVSMHTKNLQILVTKMFKVKNGESPSIMHEIFQIDDSNNFLTSGKTGNLSLVILRQFIMELNPFLF